MDVDSSPSSFSSSSSLLEPGPPRQLNVPVYIGHNQLKDLIVCPETRGELFFISGKSLSRASFDDAESSPGEAPSVSHLLNFNFSPFSLTYGCSHFALGGSTPDLAVVPYLPPSVLRSSWSYLACKLRPRAQINNSVFLTSQLQLASGFGGHMFALASNNDGSIKVLGFEDQNRGLDPGMGGKREGVGVGWGKGKIKKDWRKVDVGEVQVGVPVNHTSLSPDGRTLLSVGDSNEVHLFSVLYGGEKYKKLATYKAGDDAGFSTAWSPDGRKFAVAGQDGLISIWDHRSSKKLASLCTDPPTPFYHRPTTSSPFPTTNFQQQHELASSSTSIFATSHTRTSPYSNPSTSSSSSNLSPARVVKFSPSSSPQELLVYTDDTSNVYVADGRTFDRRISLVIPHGASGEEEKAGLSLEQRQARLLLLEEDELDETGVRRIVGTSGVGFSHCGGWMYAGTEAGIGEWEVGGRGRRGWRAEGDGRLA
ncbi:WD40-repeat-containing domain protein [Mrakia frigida]|uniref:WD40-repeat-containing domain protein n=1 Tax=Mrakia frigida TaxID=29902 RepID=UPI003FCC1FA1